MGPHILVGYWPSALLPTAFDGAGGGCFDWPYDWALTQLQLRSNERANTLGDVRMGYRLVNFSVGSEACAPMEATPIGANTDHRQLLRLT